MIAGRVAISFGSTPDTRLELEAPTVNVGFSCLDTGFMSASERNIEMKCLSTIGIHRLHL